jgi:hypothetical protein
VPKVNQRLMREKVVLVIITQVEVRPMQMYQLTGVREVTINNIEAVHSTTMHLEAKDQVVEDDQVEVEQLVAPTRTL